MARAWHYVKGDQRFGPVPTSDLQALVGNGRLHPDDLVWTADLPDWTEARHVDELAFPKTAPPIPPPLRNRRRPSRQRVAAVNTLSELSESIVEAEIVPDEPKPAPHPAVRPAPTKKAEPAREAPQGASVSFADWYAEKFGDVAMPLQVVMWFCYGFIWIPIYYALSANATNLAGGLKLQDSRWMIWSFIPYINFASWLHAGIRSNYTPYFAWAALYSIPCMLLFLLADPANDGDPPEWVMFLAILGWLAGIMHTSIKKQEVNLRMKYASARRSGDTELEQKIRAQYFAPQGKPRPAATPGDVVLATSSSSKRTPYPMRMAFGAGTIIGAWAIGRALDWCLDSFVQ